MVVKKEGQTNISSGCGYRSHQRQPHRLHPVHFNNNLGIITFLTPSLNDSHESYIPFMTHNILKVKEKWPCRLFGMTDNHQDNTCDVIPSTKSKASEPAHCSLQILSVLTLLTVHSITCVTVFC